MLKLKPILKEFQTGTTDGSYAVSISLNEPDPRKDQQEEEEEVMEQINEIELTILEKSIPFGRSIKRFNDENPFNWNLSGTTDEMILQDGKKNKIAKILRNGSLRKIRILDSKAIMLHSTYENFNDFIEHLTQITNNPSRQPPSI